MGCNPDKYMVISLFSDTFLQNQLEWVDFFCLLRKVHNTTEMVKTGMSDRKKNHHLHNVKNYCSSETVCIINADWGKVEPAEYRNDIFRAQPQSLPPQMALRQIQQEQARQLERDRQKQQNNTKAKKVS